MWYYDSLRVYKKCAPRWDTECKNILLKPRVGQNVATQASPTARNFFLALISTFLVHSPFFLSKSSPYHVGTWNKMGHPDYSHK